jgi:hypothetical protein
MGFFINNFSEDLVIYNDCNLNKQSVSNLGYSYDTSECTSDPSKWLAGAVNFQIDEIEGF